MDQLLNSETPVLAETKHTPSTRDPWGIVANAVPAYGVSSVACVPQLWRGRPQLTACNAQLAPPTRSSRRPIFVSIPEWMRYGDRVWL